MNCIPVMVPGAAPEGLGSFFKPYSPICWERASAWFPDGRDEFARLSGAYGQIRVACRDIRKTGFCRAALNWLKEMIEENGRREFKAQESA